MPSLTKYKDMHYIFKKLLQTQSLDPFSILNILKTIDDDFKNIQLEDSNSYFSDILNYKIISTKVQEYASKKHKIEVFSFIYNEENKSHKNDIKYEKLEFDQGKIKDTNPKICENSNENSGSNETEKQLQKRYKIIGLICLLYLIKFPEKASVLSSVESNELTIFLENILFNPHFSGENAQSVNLEAHKNENALLREEISNLHNEVSLLKSKLETAKKEYVNNIFSLSKNSNCDNGVLLKLQNELTELKKRLEVENSVILNAWNVLAEEAYNSENNYLSKPMNEHEEF